MYNLPLSIIKNDDGTFTVLSNIFNIVTEGDSLEEAISNGTEALACHIEGLKKGDDEWQILQSLKNSFNTYVNV
ncbi:MAG: type II toxin-antitoxin system HicB family antitoxin [Candidatus Gracilibacteria bacterium]|nr:type II toxin-antitoxin system HicB family antitoxin [Candidatus Gracilibacteria bacterium]